MGSLHEEVYEEAHEGVRWEGWQASQGGQVEEVHSEQGEA